MSTNKSSGASSGDGFWAKNGPGIMSATGTALSTTYKAGKFVGKSAYSAGKTHYNNQKGKRQEAEDGKEKSVTPTSFTPVESLRPVDHFAPPPLKPGQMQYQKGGNVVAAGDKPMARQSSYVSVSKPIDSQPEQSYAVNNQQVISPDSLQPLYNADGNIIGYVPKQTSSDQSAPLVAPRPESNRAAPPPIAPRPSSIQGTSIHVQNKDISPMVPARPRQPVPVATQEILENPTTSSNPLSPESAESDGSNKFEVTPYKYISPEDREKNTKIVIENKIDVKKMAPPPIHTGRGRNVEKAFSEIVDEKIKGLSSSSPATGTSENSSIKGISANNTNNSNKSEKPPTKPRKIFISDKADSQEEEQVKENSAVLGKYDYSKKIEFQPPPKANVPEGFVSPSTRLANMKQESENKRQLPIRSQSNSSNGSAPPAPARNNSSSRMVPPPPKNYNIPTKRQTANTRPPVSTLSATPSEPANEEKAKVLGSYDYNKTIQFAPPPSAKRSERDMEFISQKNERSRITTDRNVRYLNEQQRIKDQGNRRKLNVLQPEENKAEIKVGTNANNGFGIERTNLPPPPFHPSKNNLAEVSNESNDVPPPSYTFVDESSAPVKPIKPNSLSAPPKPIKPSNLVAPPKPVKPSGLSAPPKPKKPSSLIAPSKPTKPVSLSAPPKPTKPKTISNGSGSVLDRVNKFNLDDDENPFEKYNPDAAV